jgi:hypothetical protein
LLDPQFLQATLLREAPLKHKFAFPTYAVMSRTVGQTFRAEVVRIDNAPPAIREKLRLETMRVPGFMDRDTEADKRWDGAGAAGLPIKQCFELGATHVWGLRIEPVIAPGQTSMVRQVLAEMVEKYLLAYNQLLAKLQWDRGMLHRWVTRSRSPDQYVIPAKLPPNIHLSGMNNPRLGMLTRDPLVLAASRVAAFHHLQQELATHFNLPTTAQPSGWPAALRTDLGLSPDMPINPAQWHAWVLQPRKVAPNQEVFITPHNSQQAA